MCRTIGHRWNNPPMLVDITSITTITNNLAVNTLQICHNFEKKMSLNTPYLDFYILLISALQNAGNVISEFSEMQNFPGPPTRVSSQLFCPPDERSFLRHCCECTKWQDLRSICDRYRWERSLLRGRINLDQFAHCNDVVNMLSLVRL